MSKKNKLTLKRDTLCRLDPAQLTRVRGGNGVEAAPVRCSTDRCQQIISVLIGL